MRAKPTLQSPQLVGDSRPETAELLLIDCNPFGRTSRGASSDSVLLSSLSLDCWFKSILVFSINKIEKQSCN